MKLVLIFVLCFGWVITGLFISEIRERIQSKWGQNKNEKD